MKSIDDFLTALSEIDHYTGDTDQLLRFIKSYAEDQGYNTYNDSGNLMVIIPSNIEKSADPIIIQTNLDSLTPEIKTYDQSQTEKEYSEINREEIALSVLLMILQNRDFRHPKLYLLFTQNKFNNLEGASKLDFRFIDDAKLLINLDTLLDQSFVTESPGSEKITVSYQYQNEVLLGKLWILTVEDLTGGLFTDSNIGNGHAVRILAQILGHLVQTCQIRLVNLEAKGEDNRIVSKARAAFYTPLNRETLVNYFIQIGKIIATSYNYTDSDLKLDLKPQPHNLKTNSFSRQDTASIIFNLSFIPYGIFLQDDNEILCANNISSCTASDGRLEIKLSTKFKNITTQEIIKNKIVQFVTFTGGFFDIYSSVPPWKAKEDSVLVDHLINLFPGTSHPVSDLISENSILSQHSPELDIITLGINGKKEERSISSIGKELYETVLDLIGLLTRQKRTDQKAVIERSNGNVISIDEFFESQSKKNDVQCEGCDLIFNDQED